MAGGIIPISSLDHPDLGPYRTLRRQEDQKARGIFVAEGLKVVERLLASRIEVVSLLATEDMLCRLAPAERTYPVYVGGRRLLERITGFRMHQGIMAVGRIPRVRPLDEIIKSASKPLFFVALDGIAHAENTGVIVRNCAAFGVQAVFVGPTACSPYLRRAVRNSMGAAFLLPVLDTDDLPSLLTGLRGGGVEILGTDPHAGLALTACDLRRDVCLVLGAEDAGISPDVGGVLTARAGLPMPSGMDSLNVSSAAAVVFYEVWRQRSGSRP